MAAGGIEAQALETTQVESARVSHGLAESTPLRTPLGAPVVRDSRGEPGAHECLLSARMVAARLGVCTAKVYQLREQGDLPALRIGGALRFEPDEVRRYIDRLVRPCL